MYTKFIHRNISICLLTFSLLFANNNFFAETKTFTFGGNFSWSDPQKIQNIVVQEGFNGKKSLVLATNSITTDYIKGNFNTELLVSFDNLPFYDVNNSYIIKSNGMTITKAQETFMGNGSGKNTRNSKGLIIEGKENTLFGSSGIKGSFSIDFWLYSILAENGEQIFSWKTSRQEKKELVSQFIRGAIFNNRIEWTFHNIFRPSNGGETSFVLQAQDILIPGRWSHHIITFDEETGLLEYRVNGRTEATTYTTNNKRETGKIFSPVLGYPAPIELCSNFTGNIDELRIQNKFISEDSLDRYPATGGTYVSKPIQTGDKDSVLKNIFIDSYIPTETDISIFVRGGNNFYTWTDTEPKWIPVHSETDYKKIVGEYFQIEANLYTNGKSEKTPQIQEITLIWEENGSPWPPSKVFTVAGDGKITLKWTNSADFETTGYLVYYGERSGEYFGRQAIEGYSPIDVGNKNEITISGLTNGKIYYFAVAAYDKSRTMDSSSISTEVYARPVRK